MKIFESFKDKSNNEKMYTIMFDNNPLNKKSKQNAINYIYKILKGKYKTGIYSDDYWQGKNDVINALSNNNIPYVMTDSKYSPEFPNTWKKWYFDIPFFNNKLKEDKLYMTITASGAGPVDDPLDRYDINITF